MTSIGIVGTGVGALHLALYLQQAGIDTTVHTPRPPTELAREPLTDIGILPGGTLAREWALDVEPSEAARVRVEEVTLQGLGVRPVRVSGRLPHVALALDLREHRTHLLRRYVDLGGHLSRDAADLAPDALALHDLIVISDGSSSLVRRFPRRPVAVPRRTLHVGLYLGVEQPPPTGVEMTSIPEVGEVLLLPILLAAATGSPGAVVADTSGSVVSGLALAGVPGGPWDRRMPLDSPGHEAALLGLLQAHAPNVAGRVDPDRFRLTRSVDVVWRRCEPSVRRGWARLPSGRFAIALDDARLVEHPLALHRVELASKCAWLLAEAIASDTTYDGVFCREVEQRLRSHTDPAAPLMRTLLDPAAHVSAILEMATRHTGLADALIAELVDPVAAWRTLATPERATAFSQRFV